FRRKRSRGEWRHDESRGGAPHPRVEAQREWRQCSTTESGDTTQTRDGWDARRRREWRQRSTAESGGTMQMSGGAQEEAQHWCAGGDSGAALVRRFWSVRSLSKSKWVTRGRRQRTAWAEPIYRRV
ncbi:hypothetical protein U1Q18_031955, partial [Sarracenia purpurea var. burkii]